jgi:tryptophan synthase alpha chain
VVTAAGRLAATFAALRERGERALIPYFTAGDPSLALTRRLVVEAARRGADIVELGVPFSDPLADGPVIQRATQRALQAGGVTLPRVLELARELRGETAVPLVFLTYYNPILAFGLKAFCGTAVECGVDGVIVADLPPEESGSLRAEAQAAGLDLIHLVAPTSTPERMRKIAQASTGFLYMVSVTGVTGARAQLPAELQQHLRALRGITTKPICVGFGIGTPEQAASVGEAADGAIVGSAIVQLVEKHAGSGDLVTTIGDFIASLKEPLRRAGSRARA